MASYSADRFTKFAGVAFAVLMTVAINGGMLVKVDHMATEGYMKSLPVVQLETVTVTPATATHA
jgi:hypothetical protein